MDEKSVKLTLKAHAHALLLPVPFQGHINPFMELGKSLSALGVRVTLVTTQNLHAKILRAQQALSKPIAARHAHFSLVGIPDGLPDRAHSGREVLQAFENLEGPVLELVLTLAAQGFPVTCIVADFFLRWSPSLASRTCLPEFIFWPQCASVFSIFLHVDAFIAAGYDPFDKAATLAPDPMDKVWCIPGLSHLHIRYADLPFQGPAWKDAVEWNEAIVRHRLKHLPKAQGVLVNSFEALEAEVSKALTAELEKLIPNSSSRLLRLLGPLTALASEGSGTSLWEEEVEECMKWLDGQPPASVIFVAFGSLATMKCKAQVQELAKGLIASGQRFLWVLRKDAIKTHNLEDSLKDVKIEDALPHGFLEQTNGMGKVVHWAPQVRVLSHPSVGGFFSHCGWNSILESINAGVPILGWPSFVDQFPNCRLVSHEWRMGLELQRNELNETDEASVTNGVRELMEGPHARDMLARAIQLKKLAHEALHFSCELLAFVDDINNIAFTSSFKCLQAS